MVEVQGALITLRQHPNYAHEPHNKALQTDRLLRRPLLSAGIRTLRQIPTSVTLSDFYVFRDSMR